MKRQPFITKDGSHTISIPECNVTYHSHHGAIAESMHVYIDAGLRYRLKTNKDSELCIFEMGFGTGLNILLTSDGIRKNASKYILCGYRIFSFRDGEGKCIEFL